MSFSNLRRRHFLSALAFSVIGLREADAAGEWSGPPDVGVYCEPTLAAAIGAAGALFGATAQGGPVSVLTAPAGLLLAQVKQNPADDLLIIPANAMDMAAQLDFIDPTSRRDGWKNRLVLAARRGEADTGQTDPGHLLAAGRVAATDRTPASTLDGMGLLATLGWTGLLGGRVMGAANTEDVAFLVRTGVARFGLMLMTDVRANPDLAVVLAPDPARAPPVVYAAALGAQAHSRNAKPFLDFLASPRVAARLAQAGLEPT